MKFIHLYVIRKNAFTLAQGLKNTLIQPILEDLCTRYYSQYDRNNQRRRGGRLTRLPVTRLASQSNFILFYPHYWETNQPYHFVVPSLY